VRRSFPFYYPFFFLSVRQRGYRRSIFCPFYFGRACGNHGPPFPGIDSTSEFASSLFFLVFLCLQVQGWPRSFRRRRIPFFGVECFPQSVPFLSRYVPCRAPSLSWTCYFNLGLTFVRRKSLVALGWPQPTPLQCYGCLF